MWSIPKKIIKKIIRLVLSPFGLELRRDVPKHKKAIRPKKQSSLLLLSRIGMRPNIVIDVGVHKEGTPELYETFSQSRFVLIEPVREFEDDIKRACVGLDYEIIWGAAS